MSKDILHFDVDGRSIAYKLRDGRGPTIVFLPGYASDMEGTKAVELDGFAERHRMAMLRFDYSGTGSSSGSFASGTLSRWLDEAIELIDRLTSGPLILVGSSMGGWLALHAALLRPARIKALVGIAAAPDFTQWGFDEREKAALQSQDLIERENPYGPEPSVVTRSFWQSGQRLQLLSGPIDIACPVRLVHGEADEEVPLDVALRTMSCLRSADVQLTIVKGGGHRLSQPHELDAILTTLSNLLELAP